MPICKGCSKDFKKIAQNQIFCVKECRKSYLKKYPSISEHALRIRNEQKSVFKKYLKDRVTRECLACGKNFKSEGKFNRLCIECKRDDKFSWDMDTYKTTNGRK